ncbi:hypothetical protein FPK16_19665 [Mycobacterium tuberculosis]|nr:hypothetical protein FPK16_19665 [Mycobacterium tuberculosis]
MRAALSPGAGFAIATGLMVATRCTRLWGDCLAPPRPVLRAALSPGAGFAIATGLMVANRCTRLRRVCDRHER